MRPQLSLMPCMRGMGEGHILLISRELDADDWASVKIIAFAQRSSRSR
jgi:hypothetical protein